ncbi:hypothetical protein [Desulfosediminicola sp.]|uniref:hypothetical protein n=1 Tax=Desulfosediminicola sp. TaxID=2886825 RepID=UPI003AF27902
MTRFPWWGSVILAIIGYLGLKYGTPQLLDPENHLSNLLPQFAPVFAMGFLLLAAKQLYDDDPNENVDHDEQESGKSQDDQKRD